MTDENVAPPAPAETSSSSRFTEPARARPLTAKQQAIWDMKQAGRTRAEMAAAMQISESVVSKTLQAVYRKLGMKRPGKSQNGVEFKKPELAAAAIEAAADPMADSYKAAIERVNEQLKAAGLPGKVSEALVRRLRVKYANAVHASRELRTNEILEMLGKKIDLAAFYLDDKVLSEASARDIMLGIAAMIEKRNLLRGEPTQIISDHERKKLHELLPALIAEGQRRGLTIQGQVTEKVVEPSGS